jgi:hypothetical protein
MQMRYKSNDEYLPSDLQLCYIPPLLISKCPQTVELITVDSMLLLVMNSIEPDTE